MSCRASRPDGAPGVAQAAPRTAQGAGSLRREGPPADVWQTKPAWCQPWTILATGSSAVGGAWLLSGHRVWVACLVAVPVAAWCAVASEANQFVLAHRRACLELSCTNSKELWLLALTLSPLAFCRWSLFLGLYPRAWREYVASLPAEQAEGSEG